MRELKFRGWNKKTNRMIDFQSTTLLALSITADELRNHGAGIGVYIPDHPDLIVMQYTGLKDAKEKEIYEGDVVKIGPYYIGDSLIKASRGDVQFDNGGFYINSELAPDLCEEKIQNGQIEIIGNIHENPELGGQTNAS